MYLHIYIHIYVCVCITGVYIPYLEPRISLSQDPQPSIEGQPKAARFQAAMPGSILAPVQLDLAVSMNWGSFLWVS